MTLLFPNNFNRENYVVAQEVVNVPGPKIGDFRLPVIEPIGESRILVIVTSQPVDFLGSGMGRLANDFVIVFDSDNKDHFEGVKATFPVAGQGHYYQYGAGDLQLTVSF